MCFHATCFSRGLRNDSAAATGTGLDSSSFCIQVQGEAVEEGFSEKLGSAATASLLPPWAAAKGPPAAGI